VFDEKPEAVESIDHPPPTPFPPLILHPSR
jgi:hypothetical protein